MPQFKKPDHPKREKQLKGILTSVVFDKTSYKKVDDIVKFLKNESHREKTTIYNNVKTDHEIHDVDG